MDEHHTFVNAKIAWNLATHGTHGGDPFVNFKLYSFNLKCSQKPEKFGNPIFFSQFWSKSYWRIVFMKVSAGIIFSSSPCFFLGCLFGLPSVLSCRNTYIEYGCTWCICRYNDCLKFGNSSGDRFLQVKLPSLMSNVVKTWSIWETHFCPQSWSKTYPKPPKMSNLLGFTHVFDMGTLLFLWHLLWHCLCTPKFYPKYFYPKYSKYFFVYTRRVEIGHILSIPPMLYVCLSVCLYVCIYNMYLYMYI